MTITREQPSEVFKTTDGKLWATPEEAHTHEREELLYTLAVKYSLAHPKGVSVVSALSDLATGVYHVVRATPLAAPKVKPLAIAPR